MGTLLTIDDIRKRHRCGRDAAYQIIREAGGRKFGGVWKVREERLDDFELNGFRPKRPGTIEVPDHAAELLED